MIENLTTHPHRYVTIPELAAYMAPLSVRTLYHHAEKGALAVIRCRGVVLVRVEEACRYAGLTYRGSRHAAASKPVPPAQSTQ
jgi:hypothetical protein